MKAIYLYIWFAFINAITFIVFGIDKRKAVNGKFRIKELTLFVLSLIGGAVGGLMAMYIFHHKTRKWYFRFGIPFIATVQIILVLYFFVL